MVVAMANHGGQDGECMTIAMREKEGWNGWIFVRQRPDTRSHCGVSRQRIPMPILHKHLRTIVQE